MWYIKYNSAQWLGWKGKVFLATLRTVKMARAYDLTVGNETKVLLKLALLYCRECVQQLYNVTDTIIVGRFNG